MTHPDGEYDYNIESMEKAAEALLRHLPIDFESEHMQDTPIRFAGMLRSMTHREEFKFTTFPSESNDMVTSHPIPFYTLCAHHVVPFYGHASVSYVPNGRIVGLSKLARTVQYWAKGLWVQEELTATIANYLDSELKPLGVAVQMQAEHLCMAMRGVETAGVKTTTTTTLGVYGDHDRTAKAEFLALIGSQR